jgi:hypothetical protein
MITMTTSITELFEQSAWKPSDNDIELIENYAFVGILDPRTMATLLHVDIRAFLHASFINNRIIEAVELGKARAQLSINTVLMQIATGAMPDVSNVTFSALRYVCQSRFGYDEHLATTQLQRELSKQRANVEERKLELTEKSLKHNRRAHRDKVELETTKIAMNMSPTDAEFLSKRGKP